MGEHVLHALFWEDQGADAYLYGSDLRFLNDRAVYFENLMMPSGMSIKKWRSATVYQFHRIEPSLPLLTPGREYRIRAFYEEEPEGSVFLRLDFFTRQKKRTGSFILEGKEGTFTCPEGTYSYTADLVQGGSDLVRFYRLEIFPEEDRLFYQITDPADGEAVLSFLIPRRQGACAAVFDEDMPEGITDYMVLSPFTRLFTREKLEALAKRLAPPDAYDGIRVFAQDKDLYEELAGKGTWSPGLDLFLWKDKDDEQLSQ